MTTDQITAERKAILERVTARAAIGSGLSLALDEWRTVHPQSDEAVFWTRAVEVASARLAELKPTQQPDESSEAMTDEESKRFGEQPMQFGKYEGQSIDVVPIDYLVWLADKQGKFCARLNRYLRSPRIKAELAQTERDED